MAGGETAFVISKAIGKSNPFPNTIAPGFRNCGKRCILEARTGTALPDRRGCLSYDKALLLGEDFTIEL